MFGHCRVLFQRSKLADGREIEIPKLREGGGNNDHPRMSIEKRKFPVYHLVAVDKAVRDPTSRLSMDLLNEVSSDKTEQHAKTILHLCGHMFCVSDRHIQVGSKVLNDEQSACHRILQSATSLEEYTTLRNSACKHTSRCWTILYDGVFGDSVTWAKE
jgi:hypothetical protein